MAARQDRYPGDMTARRCPICGRPAIAEVAPFCSKRCADVDLQRWLSGVYALPAEGEEVSEEGLVEDASEALAGQRKGPPL